MSQRLLLPPSIRLFVDQRVKWRLFNHQVHAQPIGSPHRGTNYQSQFFVDSRLKKYRKFLGSLQKEVVRVKKERGKRKKSDSQSRHQNR